MDRKKELKEEYKLMKPEMGVFIIRCKLNPKSYIGKTPNLKGAMNSIQFQLKLGSCRNQELQQLWKESGEANFTIEVLDTLKYDPDETKTDYSDDLEMLKTIWKEKLSTVEDL
jgi:hypothetical protein